MLPDRLTDPSVAHMRMGMSELYRENFTASELEAMATFLRSDTAEMLRPYEWEHFRANGGKAPYSQRPALVPKGCLDGLGIHTAEETVICQSFPGSPAADVARQRAVDVKLFFLVTNSVALVDRIPVKLNAPHMIRFLEAEGVVPFTNRVTRMNVIDQLRRQPWAPCLPAVTARLLCEPPTGGPGCSTCLP